MNIFIYFLASILVFSGCALGKDDQDNSKLHYLKYDQGAGQIEVKYFFSDIKSSFLEYESQLVDLPYGELLRFYGGAGEMDLAMINEEETQIYKDYVDMKDDFVEKTKIFPEQVRGMFYHKENPEILFAKIINLPTHLTDGYGEDHNFWSQYQYFGFEDSGRELLQQLTTGGLYKSENTGRSWERIWAGGSIISGGVCPKDKDIMYVLNTEFHGGGSGEAYVALYTSDDGGKNWKASELTHNHNYDKENYFYMTWVGFHNVLYVDESSCDSLLIRGIDEFQNAYYVDLERKRVDLVDLSR